VVERCFERLTQFRDPAISQAVRAATTIVLWLRMC
jgi:hypothetical protein